MTAQSVDTFVLAFSDPALNEAEPQRARVNVSVSFELFNNNHVQTLSTNQAGGDVEGLLFVPDLDPSDSCFNASMRYVPSNVTRIGDLPTEQYYYLGLAPWFSAACTKSYLAAARRVAGLDGLIFYIPNNSTGSPPPISDGTWDLNDGGQWKSENKYPVYAIPGVDGAIIMEQLAQYSGNASSPKEQNILTQEQLDPMDYVRIYTTFGLSSGTSLPTLWAFLLIVLAIVLFIIGLTSLSMHYYQRRNRRALERRIQTGEVDLETLGTRLRVPQEAINNLPTFIYVPNESKAMDTNEPVQPSLQAPSESVAAASSTPDHTLWAQPTCPICLDDFIPRETTVRSLPCHHIYHPACIDPFLLDNSSLCPVCKAKVVRQEQNADTYEPVTNAMVRYERRARRMRLAREMRRAQTGRVGTQGGESSGRSPNLRRIEMVEVGNRAVSNPVAALNHEASAMQTRPPADTNMRREWMRRRMSAFVGRQPTIEEAERQARMPRWRRALVAVFPGFR
ncbi:MAG: hypothetical protein ASARMPREDX12_002460 [Alectoria sarmentosa]|nr:MAG: hypothetical protein ASARMPREDX12_002460 [Alectoria sarmentosa]